MNEQTDSPPHGASAVVSRRRRRRRLTVVGLAFAAAVALTAALGLALSGGSAVPHLNAQAIQPPQPVPPTDGRNALGGRIRLPAGNGRPALVTFLYTHCPTVCPLIATRIASALDRLGPEARRVDVVAISVDPRGDTPSAVRTFLQEHRLVGRMRYLIGTRAQLTPIWRAWHVAAQPPGKAGLSLHTARLVLIDRSGRQVGSYPGAIPVPPSELASDLRALVGST